MVGFYDYLAPVSLVPACSSQYLHQGPRSYMLWRVSIILIDGNLFDGIFLQFLTSNWSHMSDFYRAGFFLLLIMKCG